MTAMDEIKTRLAAARRQHQALAGESQRLWDHVEDRELPAPPLDPTPLPLFPALSRAHADADARRALRAAGVGQSFAIAHLEDRYLDGAIAGYYRPGKGLTLEGLQQAIQEISDQWGKPTAHEQEVAARLDKLPAGILRSPHLTTDERSMLALIVNTTAPMHPIVAREANAELDRLVAKHLAGDAASWPTGPGQP